MWYEITYPFPNFNGTTVEVWEWISNLIPYFTGMWRPVHAMINLLKALYHGNFPPKHKRHPKAHLFNVESGVLTWCPPTEKRLSDCIRNNYIAGKYFPSYSENAGIYYIPDIW